MSERDKPTREIDQAVDTMHTAVAGLASHMEKDDVTRGVHTSDIPTPSIKDGFGEFTRRWKYLKGLTLSTELGKEGVGEVAIKLSRTDGKKKVIGIGPTPKEWDPTRGGRLITDAEARGDYLLVIQDVTDSLDAGPSTFRYLDAEDLEGVRIEKGTEGIDLAPNLTRGRQLRIAGQVEATVAFLN